MSDMRPAEDARRSPQSDSRDQPGLRAAIRKERVNQGKGFVLDVDFEAPPGFTIVFGASGAGKTTLLDCVSGLTTPEQGSISIGKKVVFDSAQRIDVPVAKRRVGYVFQNLALFPHMTVEQNVQYGVRDRAHSHSSQTVAGILESFRIAHLAQRSARAISGGESRRVALARTLITDPEILLLDEPMAGLDGPNRGQIIADLRQWNKQHDIPILYVTHTRDEVFALGEQAIVMDGGRIVARGTPHEVMSAPHLETVAHLAGFENIFDATVETVRPERGTMTCRLAGLPGQNPVLLETPLVRGGVGSALQIGIRAGDILLATSPPVGLSARNILPGRIVSLEQRDVIVLARVNCRVEMEVHLTLAARDSLQLEAGNKEVWLVIKTHSCHLLAK